MKAIINAVPKFELFISQELLNLMINMSEFHYDLTCQAASKQGGLLFGWNNSLDFSPDLPLEATARELDLTLKICEFPPDHLSEKEQQILFDYRKSIIKLLDKSNEIRQHKIEIDV